MRKLTILAACAVLGTGVSGIAMADGAALYTAKLCHTCHGPDGNKPTAPTYPKLAGQNAAYLVGQIKDIRDGKRTNGMSAAMKAMVSTVTDEQAKSIADHLASK
uniref:Cytochrome c553 n=1 Tax=Candidatus Kentrum sp. FW TaxID=2126338 RepID=A0A450RVQ1_9GAMM|nr:MAG: Cytochrome c553 [Candidatus Kentron sp. FW]VFJ60376.1 MAG: Cytochrome c553 [Candidatus Kentron sp. FW]